MKRFLWSRHVGVLRGATAYELQVGRLEVRLLRPRFMNRRSWPWLRARILDKEYNVK